MADAGLFIGWGAPVHGREEKGLEVFNEALAYYGRQQDAGAIEGSEVVLLYPHGGDLAGFILVRGSREQIDAIRADDEFARINVRASLVVERLGVVDAALGEGLGEQIALYQEAISEVTPAAV
jgi:hypothetical protein